MQNGEEYVVPVVFAGLTEPSDWKIGNQPPNPIKMSASFDSQTLGDDSELELLNHPLTVW